MLSNGYDNWIIIVELEEKKIHIDLTLAGNAKATS